MSITKTCRFCKHFGLSFKKNGGINFIGCKAMDRPLRPDEATDDKVCETFEEDLEYETKSDVIDEVLDRKCSGCEYAFYDHDGLASPSEEDGCCGGCPDELNNFYDDVRELSLGELIDRWTLGNDKVLSLYYCGNFGDYFKGYKLVKKGDMRSFIKE